MTIKQLLKTYQGDEAELILAHVLKQNKEYLWVHPETPVSEAQQKRFTSMMQKRAKGYPVAYLLGYKYFYGLKFRVNSAVLIPRPESEWLVDKAVGMLNKATKKLHVLDAGTGSGCIILSIAKTITKTHQLTGVDVSVKALAVAKENAKALGAKAKFQQADVTKVFSKQKYDLVIANLPYVPESEYKKHQAGLKFEPKLAITDDTENGELIQKFLLAISKRVNAGANVLLEIDPLLVTHLKRFCKEIPGVKTIKFYKDLQGLERYAQIQMK